MKQIDPHSIKSFKLYQKIASESADESTAFRLKVGCTIVTKAGMIGVGWNGTPPGFDNNCEVFLGGDETDRNNYKTKPEVVHAERNALDKLSREGVIANGAILFVTTAPCIECAKSIAALGIKEVYYRDVYHKVDGLEFLKQADVTVSLFHDPNDAPVEIDYVDDMEDHIAKTVK